MARPQRYEMTYIGPSDILLDSAVSGLQWQRGETLVVEKEVRDHLLQDPSATWKVNRARSGAELGPIEAEPESEGESGGEAVAEAAPVAEAAAEPLPE